MDCKGVPSSEDYFELIVEYSTIIEDVKKRFATDCVIPISNRFSVAYVPKKGQTVFRSSDYEYNSIPRCFGLMDTAVMEEIGVAQVKRAGLDLSGSGVLVGMIDTGIDYQNRVFQYEDQSSKIYSIWDQTIENEEGKAIFDYGTEYTKEEIEQAIQSKEPFKVVPSTDTSGHGTFLASLIGGNLSEENGFTGVAPDVQLIIVKLRQAKDYLKEFYCLDPSYEAYAETDMMLAIRYITLVAQKLKKPIVLFIGMGTSLASHLGTGPLDQYLSTLAPLKGTAIVVSGGNEGQSRHHYSGIVTENASRVELKVGPSEYGFTVELWGMPPNAFYVDIESPSGQRTGRIAGGLRGQREVSFLLEKTRLIVDYFTVDAVAGAPGIVMRFQHPAQGIWNIYVTDDHMGSREFDLWLPISNFLSEDTFFLESNPFNNLVAPGNASALICVSNYNSNNGSIYIDSSRGFPRNAIHPDFAAPGVEILGALPRNRFGRKTGTSVSGAIVAGMAALMLEWGYVKGNDIEINTTRIKNYLIRGAKRDATKTYPNQEWGFGAVDLYETFLKIR